MSKKYEIDWNNVDWDEGEDLPPIKSDHAVASASNNKRQAKDPKWRNAVSKGQKKYLATIAGKKMVKERNKKTAQSNSWKEAQKEGANKKYKEDPEYNKKRITSLRKIKGRKCQTPFGCFASAADFNEQNLTTCNFVDNMKMKPHLYYYIDIGPGDIKYEDVLYTPYGIFPKTNVGTQPNSGGKDKAFAKAKEQKDAMALKYKDKYAWWSRMCKLYPNKYYIKNEPKREWLLEDKSPK